MVQYCPNPITRVYRNVSNIEMCVTATTLNLEIKLYVRLLSYDRSNVNSGRNGQIDEPWLTPAESDPAEAEAVCHRDWVIMADPARIKTEVTLESPVAGQDEKPKAKATNDTTSPAPEKPADELKESSSQDQQKQDDASVSTVHFRFRPT